MRRAVAYLRVSTEEQSRSDRASLGQQREACLELAARLDASIERWFEDPGISGGTAEKRPGFMALIDFCRTEGSDRRAVGLVLALNDSRWGRFEDPEESTFWRVTTRRSGWVVRFAEGDDTDDPIARPVLRSLHSGQASAYRANLRANAKRGARGSAAAGYWLNEAPIGYRRLAIARDGTTRVLAHGQRKSPDERSKLTPGPAAEVQLVQRLFATYAAGGSSFGTLLAVALQAMPVKRWSRPVIRAILTNPAYVGDVVWCRRPHDDAERRERAVRRESEWVTARDAHPPLITRETFAEVAAVLKRNFRARRLTTGGYPLTGLIVCGHCGEAYIGHGGPKGPPTDPDRYRMYAHRSLGTRHALEPTVCPYLNGILPRRVVEPAVLTAVAQQLADPRNLKALDRAVDRAFRQLAADPDRRRATLERERAQLVLQRDRLIDSVAHGLFTRDEITGKLATYRESLERVDLQLHQVRFAAARSAGTADTIRRVKALARDVVATAKRLTGTALREHLRPWLQSIVVDRATNHLRLTFNPLPMLPQLAVVIGTREPADHNLKSAIVRTIPIPPIRKYNRKLRRKLA